MKIDVSIETLTALDNYIKYHGHKSYDSVILYLVNSEDKDRNSYIKAMMNMEKDYDRIKAALRDNTYYRKYMALKFELDRLYEENFKMKELLMDEII